MLTLSTQLHITARITEVSLHAYTYVLLSLPHPAIHQVPKILLVTLPHTSSGRPQDGLAKVRILRQIRLQSSGHSCVALGKLLYLSEP